MVSAAKMTARTQAGRPARRLYRCPGRRRRAGRRSRIELDLPIEAIKAGVASDP
uniref:Uncharacterized protein n=1 Tax=Nonomuraea gerenzanensis TaxID=93944 RepID=A0A1M4E952_9ACTN|nr:hypothetical protein BN4615_P4820 [Nonomuraea gerenzanensis]